MKRRNPSSKYLHIGDVVDVLEDYRVAPHEFTHAQIRGSYKRTVFLQEGDMIMFGGKAYTTRSGFPIYKFSHIPVDEEGEPTGQDYIFYVHNVTALLRGIGYETE